MLVGGVGGLDHVRVPQEIQDVGTLNRIGRVNEEIQRELSSLIRTVKDPRVADAGISVPIQRCESSTRSPGERCPDRYCLRLLKSP